MNAEDFKLLKKFGKRTNKINGIEAEPLIYQSYGFVKIDLPELMNEGDYKTIIKNFFKTTTKNKVEIIPFILWAYDEFQNIQKLEKEYLSSSPDPDLINAGIERLNELGETNLIDALANGDILKWEKIKALPYHKVFDKQRKMKLEADIQKDLARIQKEKAKRKKY